jgi:hypothetical protein
VERLGILRDRILDWFESLVHAVRVALEFALPSLEGGIVPNRAQRELRLSDS